MVLLAQEVELRAGPIIEKARGTPTIGNSHLGLQENDILDMRVNTCRGTPTMSCMMQYTHTVTQCWPIKVHAQTFIL